MITTFMALTAPNMPETRLSGCNALLFEQRTPQRYTRFQRIGAVLFQRKDRYKK